ncbi:MAG TPA: hypothetical protein VMS14_02720 [Ilumatobacteraceae bacterium]|nr:hypothetical protein [Ilumatobacteraceae bacterium]
MPQLLLAVVVIAVAVAVGLVLRRRNSVQAPTQPGHAVPSQLDRADFPVRTPWLVVIFSSSTCHTCADVVAKSKVLACDQVGVFDAEYTAHKDLHRKYAIEAVPLIAIADADGVVHAGFAGPVTATDLWAAVAEVRNPGSSPEPNLGR